MKRKTILSFIVLTLFTLFAVLPSSAQAGSPQRHRWEGVAIGVGAALIGSAIIKSMHHYPPAVQHRPHKVHHYHYNAPPAPSGYWDTQKEWVPPECKKVWNPGHYNRRGRWITGRWMRVQTQPGYWKESRVWVPYE